MPSAAFFGLRHLKSDVYFDKVTAIGISPTARSCRPATGFIPVVLGILHYSKTPGIPVVQNPENH